MQENTSAVWEEKTVKKIIRYLKQNSKLVILAVAGILLISGSNFFDTTKVKLDMGASETIKNPPIPERTAEEFLEIKLANLLSQVKGAGAVTVQITFESGAAMDFAKNATTESRTIQEKDASGGIRTTTESKKNEQILMAKESGGDKPVIVSETKPVVKGVLVLAEGAGDSLVKANLTKAVETGLGVAAYRVTVLPQRK